MTLAVALAYTIAYALIISAYAYGQALQLRKLREQNDTLHEAWLQEWSSARQNRRLLHSQDVGADPYAARALARAEPSAAGLASGPQAS